MRSFGVESKKQYLTLHKDLQLILDRTLIECCIDFSLTEGYRSPEKQFGYFQKGRYLNDKGEWVVSNPKLVITNVDGYKKKGNHNYNPSLAVDIAVYVENKPELTYDPIHLTYIAGCMITIANRLYDDGKVTHLLRWGGNWDNDGDLSDNKLYDRPHFEIYKP